MKGNPLTYTLLMLGIAIVLWGITGLIAFIVGYKLVAWSLPWFIMVIVNGFATMVIAEKLQK